MVILPHSYNFARAPAKQFQSISTSCRPIAVPGTTRTARRCRGHWGKDTPWHLWPWLSDRKLVISMAYSGNVSWEGRYLHWGMAVRNLDGINHHVDICQLRHCFLPPVMQRQLNGATEAATKLFTMKWLQTAK